LTNKNKLEYKKLFKHLHPKIQLKEEGESSKAPQSQKVQSSFFFINLEIK